MPEIVSNWRGEAKLAVQDPDPTKLLAETGVQQPFTKVSERCPETTPTQIPRACNGFVEGAHVKTDMKVYLMELSIAQDELQRADPASQTSATTMGDICPQDSNLPESITWLVLLTIATWR